MLGIARRKLIRPSTLGYPGTRPGFNPVHPAAIGIMAGHGFSGIATPVGSFINLLNGAAGVNANSPTASMNNGIGPAVNYSGTTMVTTFPGQSTVNDAASTFAAIVIFNSMSGANQVLFQTGSAATQGLRFYIDVTNRPQIAQVGASNTGQTLAVVAGIPYFLAASGVSVAVTGNTNFVIKRLDTGLLTSSSAASTTAPAAGPNGTYVVGNSNLINVAAIGRMAAVMFAPAAIPMAALMAWASNDPWSFWYPK